MSFISAGFLFTIMITAFIYYLMPKKYQWVVLLIMSFAFYATYGIKYMGYIIFTIISSYIFTIKMEACVDKKNRRRLLIACLLCNFGILTGMKYINFFISNINAVGALFGSTAKLPGFKIIMPLGISFYTFQTMSYVIDVYQKSMRHKKIYLNLLFLRHFFLSFYRALSEDTTDLHRSFLKDMTLILRMWSLACSVWHGDLQRS